jgi:hypothetical protein
MFSIMLGLEEMLIGIVFDIFERLPSMNTDCAEKGHLNQLNFLSMVNSTKSYLLMKLSWRSCVQ